MFLYGQLKSLRANQVVSLEDSLSVKNIVLYSETKVQLPKHMTGSFNQLTILLDTKKQKP